MEGDDEIRAHFPLSFGKKTKSKTSLESIHNATRRPTPSSSSTNPKVDADVEIGPPRPSSSTSVDADVEIGPPRPSSSHSVDADVAIGPPRPPVGGDDEDDSDDDEVMVGPPRPPVDSDEDEMSDEGDDGPRFRIPLSNEIVLKGHTKVIKPKLARPGRVPVTTCAWDREGKSIAGGIGDGSIQVWSIKPGWGSRPDIYVANGHSDEITGLKFSSDGRILLSRSFDGTLKVWDLRQMKTELKSFEDLPNHYPQTNVAFSPDEQLLLTGTSVERDSTTGGLLCIFDRQKLELVSKVGISPTCSVVQCAWHPKLNQIFASVGDKHHGGIHVLYDPTISARGALVCVARAPRKKSIDDFQAEPVIHNPHALPLFRDQPSRKRQHEKILKDPLKSHKPEAPMNGPGFGGRVGVTKGSLLTQYLLKQGGMIKETWMDEDPREAILKYADVAKKDPKYIAPAYAETQPKTILAESDSEDEGK